MILSIWGVAICVFSLARPAGAERGQVRVAGLKVHSDLLVARKVRVGCGHVPLKLGALVHLQGDQVVFVEERFLALRYVLIKASAERTVPALVNPAILVVDGL
jgi:hypothetical protein